jgi:putative membrane protein
MLEYWSFEPSVVLGLLLFCALYVLCAGPWRDRFPDARPLTHTQRTCFIIAVTTLVVALISPIGGLDTRSLTLHMVQHLLLTLIFPPFLLLAVPDWMMRPLLRAPPVLSLGRWLTRPVQAFVLFNGVFSLWHVPLFYEGIVNNLNFHIFTHLLFITAAVVTWCPICSPIKELPRLPYPAQILYLFMQGTIPTVLGALLTFTDTPWYPSYVAAPRILDITPLDDQIYAGLIMWIPGSSVFLAALTVVFFIWFEGQAQPGEIR